MLSAPDRCTRKQGWRRFATTIRSACSTTPPITVCSTARDLFGVPTADISLIDRDEQVLPSHRGIDICGTSQDVSFCGHAVAMEDILVVLDATLDPRFADNPMVTGPPYIRFYAGVPLSSPSGHAVGTFCIVDGTSSAEADRPPYQESATARASLLAV